MRKTLIVLALAAIMVFAFAAAAYADHAPNNYIAWDGTGVNSNGPHADYRLTTKKCNVCHAVHRAAVPGEFYSGAWTVPTSSADTQMLLRSSVGNACNYCHIDTALGGARLWNGLSANRDSGAWTESGFAHNGTGCSSCHAVHGARVFRGPIWGKNLRFDIKAAVVTGSGTEHQFIDPGTGATTKAGMQDEIWLAPNGTDVAAGNVPLFTGDNILNVINGVNLNPAVTSNTKQAQSTAFCTGCHMNYGSASEALVNIDQDTALFGGGYGWVTVSGYGTWTYKNHPVGPATAAFAAGGDTTNETVVAWATAESCVACHDAGQIDAGTGVVESSYPHITPGYYRFMSEGTDAGDLLPVGTYPGFYADYAYFSTPAAGAYPSITPTFPAAAIDGHCLKCHVNSAATAGVGKTY